MKHNTFRKCRLIFLIILMAAIFISANAFGQAPDAPDNDAIVSQEAYSLAQTDTSHYAGLLEKVKAEGKIRIIVGVKASFIPEGWHTTAERVAEQRTGISRAQESLLKAIRIPDENSVKTFKYIPFVAMEVDEATLQSLMNNPMVNSIEEDRLNSPMLYETIPLIGANIGQADYNTGYTGKGQTIAILDTGVDKTHPFLSGKVVEEACFSSLASSLCPNGQTSQIGSGSGRNCSSGIHGCEHGTHVAGIAAGKLTLCNDGTYCMRGVAPNANIIAIQIFHRVDDASVCAQNNGESSPCTRSYDSDYIAALVHVYNLRNSYNIASVNMSLGSGWYPSNCDDVSAKAMIDQLRSVGIATVISSGNEGYTYGIGSPACISSAVSVGATDLGWGWEGVSSYSNSASFLSLLAPGGYCGPSCIVGALGLSGIYSSIPYNSTDGYYSKMSGTSMAAPHVAGAWALMKEKNPSASVDTILSALQSTGKSFYDSKSGVTTPRIQVNSALAALPAPPPLPNLTPYQPSGWSDKIVAATTAGATTDGSAISTTDNVYISLAIANTGSSNISSPFYTALYVDGAGGNTSPVTSLNTGQFLSYLGVNIGTLSAGTHTIKIVTDSTSAVTESDETDNEYTKTITVTQGTLPVYRFASDHDHFFTISEGEKNSIMQNLPNYHYEGIAFYAYPNQLSGTSPVYRFVSDHDHFFTISEGERNSIMQNLPNYHYEGIAFYAYPTQLSGTSPVYRFVSDHDHFFTISEGEKNSIIQNLPNYHYEGVAFYAYPTP